MKIKKHIIRIAALFLIYVLTSMAAFADINLGNEDGSGFQSGTSNNFWGVHTDSGIPLYDTEGLRITVYNAENDSKAFKTIDITGNPQISSVSGMRYFADGSKLISKTTWLDYVQTTYNSIAQNDITKFNQAITGRFAVGDGYKAQYIAELASIDIVSSNNTTNLEAIKSLLGDKMFLQDLCRFINGLKYEDFEGGKYKIAFEPVAYFRYNGQNWAMSATECGLFNKYMKNKFSAEWNRTNNLRALLGPLTHSNLPRSAFLEKKDLGVSAYNPSSNDYYNGNNKYNSDSCIIRSMGIGVLSSLGKDEENKDPGASITSVTAEYHTDTDVYTSFYFRNDSENNIFGGGKFSIYDSNGETPKSDYGPVSEKVVVGYDDDDDEEYAYLTDEVDARHISEESSVAVYVKNPAYSDDKYGVAPYKNLGYYKDGDFIDGDSEDFSYTIRSSKGTTIASGTVSFSCPSGEEAMGWFDWHTPKSAQNITITISSNLEGVYILDSNGDPSSSVKINAKVDKVQERTPPDPTATDKRPSWQKIYSDSDVLSGAAQYAPVNSEQELTWYVWTYDWVQTSWSKESDKERTFMYVAEEYRDGDDHIDAKLLKGTYYPHYYGVDNRYYYNKKAADDGKLSGSKIKKAVILSGSARKTEYTVRLSADMEIKPSEHCYTSTYSNSSGKYTMKSGYGFQIAVNAHLSGDTDLCTGSQKANVLFPEFNYSSEPSAKYNRLLEKDGRAYVFKENEYSTYNDRVHFTPIWYPDDSDYTVYAEVFDVWCPAGQLSVRLTDQMRIKGNVFDDWHVAPDKP